MYIIETSERKLKNVMCDLLKHLTGIDVPFNKKNIRVLMPCKSGIIYHEHRDVLYCSKTMTVNVFGVIYEYYDLIDKITDYFIDNYDIKPLVCVYNGIGLYVRFDYHRFNNNVRFE